jgi:hypothetical protein
LSQLPVEEAPGVSAAAHEAARGQVVYLTERGQKLAAIIPSRSQPLLRASTPSRRRNCWRTLPTLRLPRAAGESIEPGEPLIPWELVKADAGL